MLIVAGKKVMQIKPILIQGLAIALVLSGCCRTVMIPVQTNDCVSAYPSTTPTFVTKAAVVCNKNQGTPTTQTVRLTNAEDDNVTNVLLNDAVREMSKGHIAT